MLLMKQPAESLDPRQVLELGKLEGYVDLGTYRELVRDHNVRRNIGLSFTWKPRIAEATDGLWWKRRADFDSAGITFNFLCPDEIKSNSTRNHGPGD